MNTCGTYNRARKQEHWQAAQPLSGLNLRHKQINLNIVAAKQIQEKSSLGHTNAFFRFD